MSKGSRREQQAVKLYQQAGYATYKPATVRFGENDVWGLFDVLAISPLYGRIRGVQVKSNRAIGIRSWRRQTALWRRHGWITEFAVPVDDENNTILGWRLIECETETHRTVVNELKMDDVGPFRDTPRNTGDGVVEYLSGGP